MIQTILRFTCDDCGSVLDCETQRHIAGRPFYELTGSDRELLKAANCYAGKLKDRCGRCERKAREEAGQA